MSMLLFAHELQWNITAFNSIQLNRNTLTWNISKNSGKKWYFEKFLLNNLKLHVIRRLHWFKNIFKSKYFAKLLGFYCIFKCRLNSQVYKIITTSKHVRWKVWINHITDDLIDDKLPHPNTFRWMLVVAFILKRK